MSDDRDQKIQDLEVEVAALREEATSLRTAFLYAAGNVREMFDNLTATQARCTNLINDARRIARERDEALAAVQRLLSVQDLEAHDAFVFQEGQPAKLAPEPR